MSDTHVEPATSRQTPPDGGSLAPVVPYDTVTPVGAMQAIQLDSGHGKTIIADTVVAKIAAAATREIDGVHDLVTMGTGAAIAGFAGRLARSDQRATGVSVEVGQREAAVDLNMTVDYGVNIPQVAEAVRHNIMDRVRSMTGLIVKEVNINAADLYFPDEQSAPQSRVQ